MLSPAKATRKESQRRLGHTQTQPKAEAGRWRLRESKSPGAEASKENLDEPPG